MNTDTTFILSESKRLFQALTESSYLDSNMMFRDFLADFKEHDWTASQELSQPQVKRFMELKKLGGAGTITASEAREFIKLLDQSREFHPFVTMIRAKAMIQFIDEHLNAK